MSHTKPKKIWWCEPRWSYAPRTIRSWIDSFSWRAWVRIFMVSAVVVVGLAIVLAARVPNLQFNWFAAFFGSLGIGVGLTVFMLAMNLAIPPIIEVSHRGVVFNHGEVSTLYGHDKIVSVRLVFHDGGRIRFHLWSDTGRHRCAAVSPKVDLFALKTYFESKLSVRDCRRKEKRGHRRAELLSVSNKAAAAETTGSF